MYWKHEECLQDDLTLQQLLVEGCREEVVSRNLLEIQDHKKINNGADVPA